MGIFSGRPTAPPDGYVEERRVELEAAAQEARKRQFMSLGWCALLAIIFFFNLKGRNLFLGALSLGILGFELFRFNKWRKQVIAIEAELAKLPKKTVVIDVEAREKD